MKILKGVSLYSKLNLKSYRTHFLYFSAQLSWLDFTALYRHLRRVTLSLFSLYDTNQNSVVYYVYDVSIKKRLFWFSALSVTFIKDLRIMPKKLNYNQGNLKNINNLTSIISTWYTSQKCFLHFFRHFSWK